MKYSGLASWRVRELIKTARKKIIFAEGNKNESRDTRQMAERGGWVTGKIDDDHSI